MLRNSTQQDAADAVQAAADAAPGWAATSYDERAAVLLKAADLLAGPWRQRLNAATMLGQSKTAVQAEIDSACELIDFWWFNVHSATRSWPSNRSQRPGVWNRPDHRPFEGFVLAITPFNFTAIAGNLSTAPALMGNTVVWKPSPTQQVAAHLTMELLEEAGLPPGVINMLPGDGLAVSEVALPHPDLGGIHFTGSTKTFKYLWRSMGERIDLLPSYPRIVGETGGKDFVARAPLGRRRRGAHRAVARRVRVPGPEVLGRLAGLRARSLWEKVQATTSSPRPRTLSIGDVTDFCHFIGAVIDAARSPSTRRRRARRALARSDGAMAGGHRRLGGLLRAADDRGARRPDRRDLPDRVLRPDPRRPRLRRYRSATVSSTRSSPPRRTR